MRNASTTKYLIVVDLIDALVNGIIRLGLALLRPALHVLLVFRFPEALGLGRAVMLLQLKGGQSRSTEPRMLLRPQAKNRLRAPVALLQVGACVLPLDSMKERRHIRRLWIPLHHMFPSFQLFTRRVDVNGNSPFTRDYRPLPLSPVLHHHR